MTAEWVTQTFIQHFYWAHELLTAIVSDWGTQFVSSLWKRVCQLLKIVQRMFTAYHSKTDRATEWMNQNVELYICMFFNYSQNNWASMLLMAELVINNHDSVSTEVSLFVIVILTICHPSSICLFCIVLFLLLIFLSFAFFSFAHLTWHNTS